MIRFKDVSDFCDLSEDEILAIAKGANITPIEVCALVQEVADTPKECRKLLKYLYEYLEKTESLEGEKRSHEVHEAINHFVSNHHFV